MRRTFVAFSIIAASAYACSEATDGLLPYDVVFTPASADASATDPSVTEPDAPAKTFDAQTVTNGVVVLNELSAGDEWIEVVNSGNAEVDVSGWQVADRDKDTGEPKLAEGVTFPPGTKLAANAYGMVKGGGADSGDPCPGTGHAFCLHAGFGISNKNGETVFLLQGDGGVAGKLVYPPDAANGDDISWSRIPSGDPAGAFALTPATPGTANKP